MVELKSLVVFMAWFAWLFSVTDTFCHDTGERNSYKGKSVKYIECSGLSQSLHIDIDRFREETLDSNEYNIINFDNAQCDEWANNGQWHQMDCANIKKPEIKKTPCYFTIMDSIIPTLPASFLSSNTSSYFDILSLDLRSVHIETIKPGAFKLTNLEILHLDGNEISDIAHIFYFIENLQVLTLSNNNITEVDFESFSMLKNLNHLDLSGNPIKLILSNFDNNLANPLSNLRTLLLNNTLIDEFNVNFTDNYLQTLNLSCTNVRDVDLFAYTESGMIDLSHNEIVSIEDSIFRSNLLYLNHNNLSALYCPMWGTFYLNVSNNQMETIKACRSEELRILDVSHNLIATIQNDSFADMSALSTLYLQHNLLTAVPVDSFRDLHSLTELDLSDNRIRQFPSGTFNSLTRLERLNIRSNQLHSIFQLNSLDSLNRLYADYNAIKFDVADLKLWFGKSLKEVSFDHNRWSCRDLARAYHELRQLGVRVVAGDSLDVENLHGVACSSDSGETVPEAARAADESLDQFFNFDFYRSKFYKYFDEDYAKSNFFSYLRNYKFVIGNSVAANNVGGGNNKSESAKLTSLVVKPESGGGVGALAVLNLLLLAIVAFLLSCLVYKQFVKDLLRNNQENIMMQEGLIV